MICPQCKTANDDEYVFCVNCGISIGGDDFATAKFETHPTQPGKAHVPLPETVFVKQGPTVREPTPQFYSFEPQVDRPRRSVVPWVFAAILGVIAIGAIAVVVGFVVTRPQEQPVEKAELLPDHIGLFSVTGSTDRIVEIPRQDIVNAIAAGPDLLKAEGVPRLPDQPELILYADAAEVPISDLKLIKLDTITGDGKVRVIGFQASFVDGKPAMKRIRLEKPLENGRFAFALFGGFANEGKHRFWTFDVSDSKAQPSEIIQVLTLAMKPVEVKPALPQPEVSIPAGSTIAYCTNKDVRLRGEPSLDGRRLDKLSIDQKVYVMKYSENYDTWNGIYSRWAFVQTEKGKQGWVFDAFLDHGQK